MNNELILKLFLIAIVIGVIIFLYKYAKNQKKVILNALNEINGGPKTGKTFLAVHFAMREIKRNRRKWKIRNFIHDKLHIKKCKKMEEPLLYSNIPISNCKYYVPITEDLLMRNTRPNYKSVVILNEASLVANSMDAMTSTQSTTDKVERRSDMLTQWLQLFGHETHGGCLIYDTQSEEMLHNAFRRTTSSRLFIVKSNFKFPFIAIFKVKELFSCGDNNINVNDGDLEDNCKTYIVFNKKQIFKSYDCYAYSYLTDNLPREQRKKYVNQVNNKANKIFTMFNSQAKLNRKQEEKTINKEYLEKRDKKEKENGEEK